MVIKLAENDESTEIPVQIEESNAEENLEVEESDIDEKLEVDEIEIKQLTDLLAKEKEKNNSLEDKLKHTLADFQNLERKTKSDVENGVNEKIDKFFIDFLQIYDDFLRAKDVAAENKIVTDGFDSILKNMDVLLSKYGITPIDSLGEIFDPNFHEAISIVEDSSLDDDTITKEIRKGYISRQRVIRPALVEISKKSKSE